MTENNDVKKGSKHTTIIPEDIYFRMKIMATKRHYYRGSVSDLLTDLFLEEEKRERAEDAIKSSREKNRAEAHTEKQEPQSSEVSHQVQEE